jgi:hypothetical protein
MRVRGKNMKQLLVHRVTACNYLDMDEFTFESYIAPLITMLRFGDETYYVTSQIDDAVETLIYGLDGDIELALVD